MESDLLKKLIITTIEFNKKQKLFCGIYDENRYSSVRFYDTDNPGEEIGNIFVGKVKDVVKNIEAAFIEYSKGKTGYFSLKENKNIIFLNRKNTDKLCEGDEILVQLQKSAVKTKFPVLSSNLSLTGKNVVINYGKNGIGFSNKINDNAFRQEIIKVIDKELCENMRIVIRTNAYKKNLTDILSEIHSMKSELDNIISLAPKRTCFSCLYSANKKYIKFYDDLYEDEINEIITDENDIFEDFKLHLQNENKDIQLKLYTDNLLPLNKLYSVLTVIDDVSKKKVWMKSGAYLIIEPTEAMTVIDVNTGKCDKGKNTMDTILKVNLEAAEEIARQLILRNISGIIIVDFINMTDTDSINILKDRLKNLCLKDKIKTVFVDFTALNLAEITRKKVEAPVYEQLY